MSSAAHSVRHFITGARQGLPKYLFWMNAALWIGSVAIVSVTWGQQLESPAPPEANPHFLPGQDCALCHAYSANAQALRDAADRNVAPFDLWSGSMMAHSAVDPYWRAVLSAEVAATPAQKAHIEEVCSRCHAPMAQPITTSPPGEILKFLRPEQPRGALGEDGVSCTVCHQISSEKLGSPESFMGGFVLNTERLIYGPHAEPVTMPMQRHVNYTPTEGQHLLSSALCATCHTVITDSVDAQGVETHLRLHEQVPYLEWQNSLFNDEQANPSESARSCQDCHMPTVDDNGNPFSTRLAHNPGGRDFPFLKPRQPYGLHTFAGGNVFMTRLIRDHREELRAAGSTSAFDRVIAASEALLRHQTAKLTLDAAEEDAGHARVRVQLTNLAGHKFPTAYPARRSWVQLLVYDADNHLAFASGLVNEQGELTDAQGRLLDSEQAGGPVQPHYSSISRSDQVQIYETIMEDAAGEITFTLLRGGRFRKDNRLLPQGWQAEHPQAAATEPQGISGDPDFLPGRDSLEYELELPAGIYRVEARLLFQPLSSRWVAELWQHDTSEVASFRRFFQAADHTPQIIDVAHQSLTISQ